MKSRYTWDKKESDLFVKLSEEWGKYTEPGKFENGIKKAIAPIEKILPKDLMNNFGKYMDEAMSWKVIKKVTTVASKGFFELGKASSKYTLSSASIKNALQKRIKNQFTFDTICGLRSYEIEKCVLDNKLKKQFSAMLEGGITGFFGFWGVPFNIVFSILLYFRAVQHIALYYGYDVIDDPRELEISSEVLINSISPSIDNTGAGVGSYMARAMFCAEMSSLGRALTGKKTFETMAKSGGSQLFYTQIRALANAAARKGLEKAGKKGIENVFLKKILENVGRKLPKQMAGKAVPVLGALVGGGFDTFYMTRVVDGANLQYHKRFLIEKDERNKTL